MAEHEDAVAKRRENGAHFRKPIDTNEQTQKGQ